MKPANVPADAIPVPLPKGPFTTEQMDQVHSIQIEVEHENAVAEINFKAACDAWTVNNLKRRDDGQPPTLKPTHFERQTLQSARDEDTGTVWIWIEFTAVDCPDLPPSQRAHGSDFVHVGIKTPYSGEFWTAAADNTYNGTEPIPSISDDGVTGVWQFVGSAMGKGRGWYRKVA